MPVVTDYTGILLDNRQHWANANAGPTPVFLTYSFETIAPSFLKAFGYSDAAIASFTAFTEAEKAAAREALDKWAAVCGIVFFEVPAGQGDMRFSGIDTSLTPIGASTAYGTFSSTIVQPNGALRNQAGGDVFLDRSLIGSGIDFSYLFLHEIGHTLGFKHTFDGTSVLDPSLDTAAFTVMSYNGTTANQQLGTLDIQAAQAYYGTNAQDGTQVASWSWNAATYTLTQIGFAASDTIIGVATSDIMFGNDGADILAGFEGNDSIDGGIGNDTLFGGLGDDTLIGGAGLDTLDGGENDDTALIDANSGSYSFRHVGQAFNYWYLDGPDGTELYGSVESVQFNDRSFALRADSRADLTGDGASEIVWINASNGAANYFNVVANYAATWNFAGVVSTTWTARAAADMNGDGSADILYRRASDGAIGYLESSAGTFQWMGAGLVDASWDIIAVTDTNNDAIADIVYRNDSIGGAVGVLSFSAGGATQAWTGAGLVGTAWTAAGAGDTNLDGRNEVIFHNAALGVTGSYDVNGTWRPIGTQIPTTWSVAGVGDIDGNGTHDILLYNASLGGALNYWSMGYDGSATWASIGGIGSIGGGWAVKAMGDYDQDGDTDILFYNAALAAAGVIQVSPGAFGGTVGGWIGLGSVDSGWQIL